MTSRLRKSSPTKLSNKKKSARLRGASPCNHALEKRHINPSAERAHHALMALCTLADRSFPTKREDSASSLNCLRSLLLGRELFQLVRQLPHLFVGEGAGCLLVGLELLLDLTDPLHA